MVSKFSVEDHPWTLSLYEKRAMWCAAIIRGKVFAGYRTTSRCEGLHYELGKFVHSCYNMTDFLK